MQSSFFSDGKRLFSSSPGRAPSSPTPVTAPATSSSDRVSRTLYRQLLQWCNRRQKIDATAPLSFLIPPMHLQAPEQVDSYRLELLAHNFYSTTIVEQQQSKQQQQSEQQQQ
jgi:hypothetical protein